MKKSEAWLFFISGMLALVVAIGLSAVFSKDADEKPPPEVSLAIITGAALVIERALELLWALIDSNLGSFWPLSRARERVDNGVKALDELIEPTRQKLLAAAAEIPDAAQVKAAIEAAFKAIPRPENLKGLTNNQTLDEIAVAASSKINQLLTAHPGLRQRLGTNVDLAGDLLGIGQGILEDFKDNPGRKVISIYFGAILGVGVATVAQVDVFHATESEAVFGDLAVPFTGVLMGLGANPTHEVIAALKKYKESKKQPASV
jgi:hypothetical protein